MGPLAALSMLTLGACSGPAPASPADAAVDAPLDASADAHPTDTSTARTDVALAAPPNLTPCAEGWRVVPGADFPECDPWPEGGRGLCGPDEAHFPGEAGCRRIGDPCPEDGMPVGLPPGAVYVRPGATGGDGTLAAPLGSLADAYDAVGPDGVIGLSVGSYLESLFIFGRSVSVVGACVDTVIEPPTRTPFIVREGTLNLRNLRLRSPAGGVIAQESTVNLESLVIEDIVSPALSTIGENTVHGRDILVRRAASGALFLAGTTSTFVRLALEEITDQAISVSEGSFEANAVVVDGVSGDFGSFLSAVGATVRLENAFLSSDPLASIIVTQSTLRLADVAIWAPPTTVTPRDDAAILAVEASTLDLERVAIVGSRGLGVGIGGVGTEATIRDLLVRDVRGSGHGLEVGDGARADLGRVAIDRAGRNAMLVFGAGTVVAATDLHVRSSRPNLAGHWGRGLGVQTGATFSAQRVLLENHHEVSLVVASEGTTAAFFDLVIRATQERACAISGCPPAGIGMGAYLGGAARVERFRIEDNALVGVQIANEGVVELVDGLIAGNPVGANIQAVDYDLRLLMDRVEYRDNGQNLDSTALFVPDVTVP